MLLKLVIAGLFAIPAMTAQAIVADQFACEFTFQNAETGQIIESRHDAPGIRRSLSQSPRPDVRLYTASFDAELFPAKRFGGGMGFVYDIAVEVDESGQAKRAVMKTCITKWKCKGGVCLTLGCGEYVPESGTPADPKDPFDPNGIWNPIELTPSGVPIFDAQFNPKTDILFENGSKLKISCRHTEMIH